MFAGYVFFLLFFFFLNQRTVHKHSQQSKCPNPLSCVVLVTCEPSSWFRDGGVFYVKKNLYFIVLVSLCQKPWVVSYN